MILKLSINTIFINHNNKMLKTGDKVPINTKVFDENKEAVTLKKYLDQPLVIYFYLEDNTRGCTHEAKEFNLLRPEFNKLGYKIIGISKDPAESQRKFNNKLELNFELLSDPEKKMHKKFGVWQEKRKFYRTYMGTVRSTFAVDEDGTILKSWARVRPKGHAKEVLKAVRKLNKKE